MHALGTVVQHYDWGSPTVLPRMLGEEPDGSPWAELWMGTHPLGQSTVAVEGGAAVPLSEVVGRPLPYLLKILAIDKPLSLQVHPEAVMAERGFARENERGVALDAPHRVFKDPYHKPEMVYALTPFEGLIAFRPTAEVWHVLEGLESPLARRLNDELGADPGFPGLVRMVGRLLSPWMGPAAEELDVFVAECQEKYAAGLDRRRAYETVSELAQHHPGDPGLVVAALLNRVRLAPGEAAFVEVGVLHAYLSGTCVEVMAGSDNVLRAGLTTKHIEPQALVDCVRMGMAEAHVLTPKEEAGVRLFAPEVDEFALAVATVDGTAETLLPGTGPRIVLCVDGTVTAEATSGSLTLTPARSAFVPDDAGAVHVRGTGTVVQAYAP
ncbi:mannose-6-phosphate isomerase, class I [Mumia sp. zg.B21]|uniref:mannose-6-phosphate isomerase, class I n=1 Tax=Mumia sp. zg.B21 TaxID=2855447 RepID=UPI001C6EC665|nr:mannose-6-phosphate isomerase, class I [Mumia sp. zg.B21]MBW9210455.1 mannose-6-phosphate isomerase, class I [Mumia sp. zg.B21]